MQIKLTPEMLQEAEKNGWSASQAARQYGVHHSSVANAAERYGIALPYAVNSPYKALATRKKKKKTPLDLGGSDVRVKAFSAHPTAIARAARNMGVTL